MYLHVTQEDFYGILGLFVGVSLVSRVDVIVHLVQLNVYSFVYIIVYNVVYTF